MMSIEHALGLEADKMIAAEVERQDRMWGQGAGRADAGEGQLMGAAMAQLEALDMKLAGLENAFTRPPANFPGDWTGFRDYGSDIANLVVAAAYLRQEIKRRLLLNEDTTRTSRDPEAQPFAGTQPRVIEP